MKQKYKLSIADVELNVTVDEAPETVEYIVGVIDRRMREILLKSKYCPKTQAALLCALDLCAEKVHTKAELDALSEQVEELETQLKKESERYDSAQRLNITLEREKARLEIENMKLREIIEAAKRDGVAPIADIDSIQVDVPEVVEAPAEEAEAEEPAPKKKSTKKRVGSMFDLLTFSDI
jgi:cell division protein ZapA (FtsZ GTPase activity inhibitor)